MTVESLQTFFMWCTVINFGLLLFSFFAMIGMSNWAYQIHSRWFSMSRETFDVVVYSYFGLYKIFIIVFNLVPWIALSLMAG